jgi:SAM-dependent methyltransferase
VGDEVLEVGAGIGNLTGRLMARRMLYIAAETDPLHLHALRNRFLRTPNVAVQRIDPEVAEDLAGLENCFDTVLCLNLLERLENPAGMLRLLGSTLKPGGLMVILVPNSPGLFGSLDRSLGHKRRYTGNAVRQLVESEGLSVESIGSFNKVAALPWWAYSKVFGAGNISKLVLKIFDKSVWIWRRLDLLLPWPGLSLLVVARQSGERAPAAGSLQQREAVGAPPRAMQTDHQRYAALIAPVFQPARTGDRRPHAGRVHLGHTEDLVTGPGSLLSGDQPPSFGTTTS